MMCHYCRTKGRDECPHEELLTPFERKFETFECGCAVRQGCKAHSADARAAEIEAARDTIARLEIDRDRWMEHVTHPENGYKVQLRVAKEELEASQQRVRALENGSAIRQLQDRYGCLERERYTLRQRVEELELLAFDLVTTVKLLRPIFREDLFTKNSVLARLESALERGKAREGK